MNGTSALGAGWLLVLTTVLAATLGALLGGLVDLRLIGGLAGGVLGTIYGFVLVWKKYVKPDIEASQQRDYSKLELNEIEEDDEDHSW